MFLGDSATGFMPDMLENPVLKKIVGLLLAYVTSFIYYHSLANNYYSNIYFFGC